jgi:hypothetical protein
MPQPENTKPIPGFQNPKCYARSLGGCCKKISAEHWLSKSILELVEHGHGKKSKVVAFTRSTPEREGITEDRGVGSLTGKMLCVAHNGRLSGLDSAGKKMFEAMESVHHGSSQYREKVHHIDGDLLERFLLKTICGGMFSGNMGPLFGSFKGVPPRLEWLKALFEGISLPDRYGLYYIAVGENEIIRADRKILDFTLLTSTEPKEAAGIRAKLFGIEFVLLMADLPQGIQTPFETGLYRPSGLRVDGSNARIEFEWKDGPRGGEILLIRLQPIMM